MVSLFSLRLFALLLPALWCSGFLLSTAARGAEPVKLVAGDQVAICGDSITEQRLYSMDIEAYLLACQPATHLQAAEFGWGGETVTGFLPRMDNDVLWFKPNVATLCYGMNDAGYNVTDVGNLANYRKNLEAVVKKFKAAGVRDVVVGTPGVVDTESAHRAVTHTTPENYNHTLADFGAAAKAVAEQEGVGFADVHGPMMDVMAKMKAKYGQAYVLAGPDGVHPNENGHLVMAYAFLKALGCNGAIGTLTLDMASGLGSATEGHRVLRATKDTLEVESSRYPFCYYGADTSKPQSTRGVLEFLPFNQELNRFMLLVVNAPAGKYKVTWGQDSREFDAAELAKGVNLAAEFFDNPFTEPFKKVQNAVTRQQNFEVVMMKDILHNLPEWKKAAPGRKEANDLEGLRTGVMEGDAVLRAESAAAVVPVRYEVHVEAVER